MTCKTCSRCAEEKPLDQFKKDRTRADGRSYVCSECRNAQNQALYERTKERKLALGRQWYENNREYRASKVRDWQERNREKFEADKRAWKAANRHLAAAHSAKRKAAFLQRCVLLTPAEEKAVAALYAESRRLTQETGIPHHVDHIAPLQGRTVSGLHVYRNLRIIPASENVRKHAKVDPDLIAQATMAAWF